MNFDIENLKTLLKNITDALKKDKKITGLLIISLAAIFVLTLSEAKNKVEFTVNENSFSEYNLINNDDLEAFLENISGAGRVEIMVTYDSSKEYIYAKDTDENAMDKNDSGREINFKSEHIIIKEDGNEKGLMIKEIYPEIRGIAVICDGGNNPVIREQMVNILSALFGINTNRISVAAKSS